MVATAKMESNFNPKAAATTSSARGLFQFIDQTWLGTVKEAGAQFGYGKYADAITETPSGGYAVSDPADPNAIMKLRDDPAAASSMAAVFAQSNSFKLTGKIGRRPTDGELYIAHFMGVGGAGRLISQCREQSERLRAAAVSQRRRGQPPDLLRQDRARAQRLRSLFGADLALRQRRQFAGHPHRDGRGRRRCTERASRSRVQRPPAWLRTGAGRQRRLSLELSGPARRHAGGCNFAAGAADRLIAAGRSDLPLAVPGRRAVAAGLAGGSGIVGQFVFAATARIGRKLRSLSRADRRKPEVRAPGRLDLFSDRAGTFSS